MIKIRITKNKVKKELNRYIYQIVIKNYRGKILDLELTINDSKFFKILFIYFLYAN